jgi:hypothetical protein
VIIFEVHMRHHSLTNSKVILMDRLQHHPQDRLRMRFPGTLTDLKKVKMEIDRFEICLKMKVMNHLFETDQRKTMNDLSETGRKNQGTGCHY